MCCKGIFLDAHSLAGRRSTETRTDMLQGNPTEWTCRHMTEIMHTQGGSVVTNDCRGQSERAEPHGEEHHPLCTGKAPTRPDSTPHRRQSFTQTTPTQTGMHPRTPEPAHQHKTPLHSNTTAYPPISWFRPAQQHNSTLTCRPGYGHGRWLGGVAGLTGPPTVGGGMRVRLLRLQPLLRMLPVEATGRHSSSTAVTL